MSASYPILFAVPSGCDQVHSGLSKPHSGRYSPERNHRPTSICPSRPLPSILLPQQSRSNELGKFRSRTERLHSFSTHRVHNEPLNLSTDRPLWTCFIQSNYEISCPTIGTHQRNSPY